jgi:carboxymethylenebutenolidase
MNDRRNMYEHSNPVQNVTFASNGDEAYGYLALPASGSGPGVIVIQEWWGVAAVAGTTRRPDGP